MIKFTNEELEEIRAIIIAWIGEGFTTPPYSNVLYDVFEKLGIDNEYCKDQWFYYEGGRGYNVERPHSSKESANK